MAIIISKKGKNAEKVEESSFKHEDYLQKYIYDNPESIPLYDIETDIKLLILAREFPTKSGSIDALGIDKKGQIYVIETKLYKNPDKRLVVAQVLDYGASLWRNYNDFNEFIQILDKDISKRFNVNLNQRIKEFFKISDEELVVLMDNLRKNLDDGNFKFVVLMDHLQPALKDLIMFINQNSQFDIFAVELEYYKYKDYEIMIPKLFGSEVKKDIGISGSGRREWDEDKFMSEISKNIKDAELKSIKKIYDFCKQNTTIYWGSGSINGSFNAVIDKITPNRSIITIFSNGKLVLNFGWLNDSETSKKYRDLFGKLITEKTELKLQQDWKGHFPVYKINEWSKSTDKLIAVIDELIKK